MARSAKDIRRRIRSVSSTKKITRAMEMVSAAKMRRSVASVLKVRTYAKTAWSVLTNLSSALEGNRYGLLEVRPVKRVLMIVVTSNRGLCGAFNSQLLKKVKAELADPTNLKINRSATGKRKILSSVSDDDLGVDFITVGRKGERLVRKIGRSIVATFPELTYFPTVAEVRPLARIALDGYREKKYDKVVIAYTDYVSTLVQQPKIRQILPISKVELEKQIAEMDVLAKDFGLDRPSALYKIEPSTKEVLDDIIPRLAEMQLYHAILESNASKEASRMMAMRNATEAAEEMVEGLELIYNQIRQAKITQEIAEISAGSAALE